MRLSRQRITLLIIQVRFSLLPGCFVLCFGSYMLVLNCNPHTSFQYRSCMERRRTSTKEFQGPSYPLVCRSEGEKSAGDAVVGGETCGCPFGPDTDQAAHVQGIYTSPSESEIKLTLRFSSQCRKTMARIKYIINERRLAYEGAVQIITEDKEREVLTRRERTAARRKTALEARAKKTGEQQTVAPEPQVVKAEEPPVVVHRTAAERAAAGLVQPDLVRR